VIVYLPEILRIVDTPMIRAECVDSNDEGELLYRLVVDNPTSHEAIYLPARFTHDEMRQVLSEARDALKRLPTIVVDSAALAKRLREDAQ
jgi:hypothetical protein